MLLLYTVKNQRDMTLLQSLRVEAASSVASDHPASVTRRRCVAFLRL
jgi:hypothetical protein